MSMLVEPGTRLAGRYRLQEQVNELDGSTLWKAIDEPLARPVAVRTFTGGFPHVNHVIAAARAASRVADSRLAQVFDADDSGQHPYLVCEWIDGNRLIDLLAEGPLDPERAVGFIREATDALAAAHAAGLAHQRLDPAALIWAKGGTVKITGLAIDAALHGQALGGESSITDVRALGSLLYAALTGYWPGDTDVGLPPAPRSDDGIPLPVRAVRPELPPAVEAATARALGQDQGTDPPFDSPDALRGVLAGLPRISLRPTRQGDGSATGVDRGSATASPAPAPAAPPVAEERSRRAGLGPARILLISAVGALVLAATALGAWEIGRTIDGSRSGPPAASPGASGNAKSGPGPALNVNSIEDHDPLGDQQANPSDVPKAVDGDPSTFWTTQTYTTADLGNLKPGVGLMLDMGERASFRDVRVLLADEGTSLQLYTGDQPDRSQMTRVASAANASGQTVLRPREPAQGRYVLLWLTKLPSVSDGHRAGVGEIIVHGS